MRERMLVVGVDGSEGGRRALRWALEDVADHGGFVQAVTAWQWETLDASLTAPHPEAQRERAATMLDQEISDVLVDFRHPPPVAGEVVEGEPAAVLSQAARDAALLVVGSHGRHRLYQAVMGSVTAACVRHATCPVLVVPVPHEMPSKAGSELARPSEVTGAGPLPRSA